jgi:DHA1 family bicyclomycin/chloramphenicol resistance-like MFS transporter
VLRPGTFALTVLLAALTGIGPLTTDMYLPSLPEIASDLHATTAQTQLTISTYLIGFAIGQVIWGPFADRHGRKVVMLTAIAIYIAATVVASLAPSIEVLIVARAMQGVGGSGGIVLARAVVRDLYSGARAGREMSVIGAVMALAPVVAPAIGGLLETAFGWRSTFYLLTMGGVLLALTVWGLLPETLKIRAAEPVSPGSILRSFRVLVKSPSYLAHVALAVLSFAGLFAWISGSSFILQGLHGLSAFAFGMAFAVGSAGYMAGTVLAARIVAPLGLDRTMGVGSALLAAGGLCMVAAIAAGYASAVTLVASVAIYLAGMGLVLPQAAAGALTPFPERAGAASSLLGFFQQSIAAIVGIAVGLALGTTAWPMAIAIASVGCLALLVWFVTRDVRARTA